MRYKRPNSAPAPAALSQAIHKQVTGRTIVSPGMRDGGFSLVELMLGIAVVSVMGIGTAAVYSKNKASSDIRHEQDNIQTMVKKLNGAYGATGSFVNLTTQTAISANAAPRKMIEGSRLRSVWGSDVTLSPTNVDGRNNAGLRIVYDEVPSKLCPRLATSVADGMWDILVDGQSVMVNHEIQRDPLATLCAANQNPEMVFLFYGGATGLAVTAPPSLCAANPSNPLCLAPPPPTPTSPPTSPPIAGPAPPPPPLGAPLPPPPAAPPGAPPASAPPPGAPTSPPPSTPPMAPPGFCPPVAASTAPKAARDCTAFSGGAPGSDGVCEDGSVATATQTFNCPAGQVITTPGPSQFQSSGPQTRTRNENHAWQCTDPWNDNPASFSDVWAAGAWNAWTPAYACDAACTPPAPATASYSQMQSCLAGRLTPGGAGVFTQTRTGTATYSCAGPVGPVVASPESFTPWTPTEDSACVPVSPPPASPPPASPPPASPPPVSPPPVSPPACGAAPPPASQTLGCPAGTTGSGITQSHGWDSAAAPTCWQAQAWATTANNCTPIAPPPSCTYEWGQWQGPGAQESLCSPPPAINDAEYGPMPADACGAPNYQEIRLNPNQNGYGCVGYQVAAEQGWMCMSNGVCPPAPPPPAPPPPAPPPPAPPPPVGPFIIGCGFSGPNGAPSGFMQMNECGWDPSGYQQTDATVGIGTSIDGSGYPTLDTSIYRVEMSNVSCGITCSTYRCNITINATASCSSYSRTRVQVFRRSDNVEVHNEVMVVDFSML